MEKTFKTSYIDIYLAIYDKTRYDIHKQIGVPESTLSKQLTVHEVQMGYQGW